MGKSLVNVKKLNDFVSVKDFGAVGDGVADDTAAIQAALDSSVSSSLYFPKGTYLVTSTLKLPSVVTLFGGNIKGASQATTINYTGSGFCMETAYSTFAKYKISGVRFNGNNLLDMRGNSASFPVQIMLDNCTFTGGDGSGVAISIMNSDFSTISDCGFFNWSGVCGILVLGWMDTTTFSNNKNTTQCNISRNIFSSNQQIGISLDIVDSCRLESNDFSGTGKCIDIGGYWYSQLKSSSTGSYFKGVSDPTILTWNASSVFSGSGWFSNVTLDSNHYEFSEYGIYAKGIAAQGRRVVMGPGENHLFDSSAIEGVHLDRVHTPQVFGVHIDYKSNTTAKCINYLNNRHALIDKPRIFSGDSGLTTSNAIVDGGGNFFSEIIHYGSVASSAGDFDDSANPTFANARMLKGTVLDHVIYSSAKSRRLSIGASATTSAVLFSGLGLTDMADANYSVYTQVEGANINSWVTAMATTGFTINLASNPGTTVVHWIVIDQ